MSRVHPPERLLGLGGRPFGAKTPGCGQVRASFGMYCSMLKGVLRKWLVKVVLVVVSVQSAGSGGDVRLTSFCSKQWYGGPPRPNFGFFAPPAFAPPLPPPPTPQRVLEPLFSPPITTMG